MRKMSEKVRSLIILERFLGGPPRWEKRSVRGWKTREVRLINEPREKRKASFRVSLIRVVSSALHHKRISARRNLRCFVPDKGNPEARSSRLANMEFPGLRIASDLRGTFLNKLPRNGALSKQNAYAQHSGLLRRPRHVNVERFHRPAWNGPCCVSPTLLLRCSSKRDGVESLSKPRAESSVSITEG